MTIHELLEDKQYREFFTTAPHMPPAHPDLPPRWRVYVQREAGGRWAKKEVFTYGAAFKFLKPHLKVCHDAAIQSKGIAFPPPVKVVRLVHRGKPKRDKNGQLMYRRIVWQPKLPEAEVPHTWCTYCRRPTIFAWFSRHHSFPGVLLESPYQRCVICGASERLVLNHV